MKRISVGRKQFVESAGVARWEKTLRRKGKLYRPDKKVVKRTMLGQSAIIAPRYISIYESEGGSSPYIETIAFIDRIKTSFKLRDCVLDFSNTEKITAAALVVVYAAVEMASVGRAGKASMIMASKSNNAVNRALKSSNFQKLVAGHGISYSLATSRYMPVVSGVGGDLVDDIVDFIQKRIFAAKMNAVTEHVYGDAVSETIYNVELHAYPKDPESERRWWLICSPIGRKLFLAIYDQGVGIPATVIEKSWFNPLVKYLDPVRYKEISEIYAEGTPSSLWGRKIPDERLISYSMRNDVSGTKEEKHGQGSKSIKALVNETKDGLLWVFSNNGLYKYSSETKDYDEIALPKSFPGTLVQWNIEIP